MPSQSPQGSPEVTIKVEELEAPGPLIVGLGSPASSCDSTAIYKVSNSDDEDMIAQARPVHKALNTPTRNATQLSTQLPRVANQAFQDLGRPMAAGYGSRAANLVSWPSTASTTYGNALYRSPYVVAEHEQRRYLPLIERISRSALPENSRRPAQAREEAGPSSQWSAMRPPDAPPAYFGPASRIAPSGANIPPRFSYVPRQYIDQRSDQSEFFSMSMDQLMRKPCYTPHQPSRDGSILPRTDYVGTQTQRLPPTLPDCMFPPSCAAEGENHIPSSNIEVTSVPQAPKDVEARRYTLTLPATNKHAATPPRNDTAKRRNYTGFGPDDITLPYNTIKVIKIPARNDITPGQTPPEPTPDNLPYGDTEDYQSCMLIHWLDEQELSYREGIELFKQKFPHETANYETIRRRHLIALQRLARKYGVKPDSEIKKPGEKVARRGRHAGAKYSTIGGRVLEPAATHAAANTPGETAAAGPTLWSQPQANGSPTGSRRVRVRQPVATRGLLLACIVVWKDIDGATFDQIQKRLADDFDWKLGYKIIQKLYYEERPRVLDVRLLDGDGAPVGLEDEASTVDAIKDGQCVDGKDARRHVAGDSTARCRSL